jgi:hypothetical protein
LSSGSDPLLRLRLPLLLPLPLLLLLLLLLLPLPLQLTAGRYPPVRSIKTKRHLDRSWSQPYRDQRSGEIPVFAFAVAVACLFVCRP